MRAILHYFATMIIVPFYGIRVCPFIETLSPMQVAVPIISVLAVQYMVRSPLRQKFVDSQPLKRRVARVFWLEMGLFAISAIIVMAYNEILYGFPFLESGLKILFGLTGLGFFAASDIALEEERLIADKIEQEHITIDPDENYFPLTRKVVLFASVSISVLVLVFMLLVVKDLDWIIRVGASVTLRDAQVSILKEFAFVLLVILPHTLNIIRSFARNLNRILSNQNSVLTRVTLGDYDLHVPVASNDEFGVMAQHTNVMVDRIKDRTKELALTRDVTILSLASLAETRDNETGAHLLRTQRYVRALAVHLKDHPNFSAALDDDTIDLLYKSAPLHDVGKVGIPDAILLKPGKLTDDEFVIMKTHARLGAEALHVAEKELGSNSFMSYAREIAESHHEKWDGSGYPNATKGTDIPIAARLMAVADVYDALISKRVYKPAFSHDKAMNIIREGRGSHFDPDIVDALNAVESEFQAIAAQFGDQHTQAAE
ncbi:HD domain-containing phosphohydrolase [Magnetovibrio blakemorei]|uniref:Histidine kinase n=1 Tax=Magnetovibrio blakemorei TaxID=28181 RepID=A0A1E5QBE0_9PROT|nr:HD domain-containing phosphohydrolase [Magnetovibrio blakemorei]OEJ69264.1 histidine kinase [Magnetovibrio blakemorei]